MADTLNLNVVAPADIAVGGQVTANGGYSNDPTRSINAADDAYSFIVYNVGDLPSYAVDALNNGTAALKLTFQASTSDIIPVTVKAYAADDLFLSSDGTVVYNAVDNEVATPSSTYAAQAHFQFDANAGTSVAQVTIKAGFGPASPSKNENTPQTVDITSQALATLANGHSNLVVYFHESGATPGYSVNVTNVSASVVGGVFVFDSISNAGATTQVIGSVATNPFAGVTITSQLPANLVNNGGAITINPISLNATSTDFVDSTTVTTGSNDYLILQSNSASGTLSGLGLTMVQGGTVPYVPSGKVGYIFSGTAAQATALLHNLVFTPSAAGPSQTTPTTFSIAEAFTTGAYVGLTNLSSIDLEVNTGSFQGGYYYGVGTNGNQLVTMGGVAIKATLHGGTQDVTQGGTANATVVDGFDGGNVNIEAGGTSNDVVLTDQVIVAGASREQVSGSGVANRTSVGLNTTQTLSAGGTANGTTINNGGLQTVGANSSANTTHILSGGFETVASGGKSDQAVIDQGGRQDVSGVATRASVSGVQNVLAGGQAVTTTVASGGAQNDSGATANTTIQAGGKEIVAFGGKSDQAVIDQGGRQVVSGVATRANVSGVQNVLAGGQAVTTTVASGGVQNDSGATANTTVQAGGKESVASGGTADSTSVTGAGAILQLNSGATATRVTANKGGSVTADGTVTLAGLFGDGALVKTGAGVLTLSGASGFIGTATVSGGTLAVASDNSLGDGRSTIALAGTTLEVGDKFRSQDSVTVQSSATVQVDGGTATLNGVISGTGSLSKTGGGTLVLSGTNSFTGGISLQAGTLELLNSGASGTGGVSFKPGGEVLKVDGPAGLSTAVTNFDADDTLDLAGLAYTPGASATLTGNTLVVTSGTASETFANFSLASGVTVGSAGNYAFSVTSDGAGGSALRLDPVPFGTGSNGSLLGTIPAPSFSGVVASQSTPSATSIAPFGTVTVADTNPGATEVITLTQTGPGVLSNSTGTFTHVTVNGATTTYTFAGTAAAVTSVLEGLVFTPATGTPGPSAATTFTLNDASSAGSSASAGTIIVTAINPAAAPTITLTSAALASNKATQTITGTVVSGGGSLVGQTVTLTDNGAALGTATVAPDGTFKTDVTLPNQGANAIVATVIDSYGNVGTSAAVVDTLDNIAPTIKITSAAVAGNVAGQTITGTAATGGTAAIVGQTVTLTDNNNTLGTATIAADGSFKTNVVLPNQGANTIVATVTDSYGNVGSSAAVVDTLDTVAPTTPATPVLTAGSDSGSSSSDHITNVRTSTLTGSTEAGATVRLYDGSGTTVLASTLADGNGVYTLISPALADGAHSLTVTATDIDNNTSARSAALSVTIDTQAPGAPAAPRLAPGSDSGFSSSDNYTNVTTPTLTGITEAGATVKLYDGSRQVGSAVAGSDGSYRVTSSTLAAGAHALSVGATDVAGNVGVISAATNVTIDTSVPAPVITSGPGNARRALRHIAGAAGANVTVTITDTNSNTGKVTVLGQVTSDANGNWSDRIRFQSRGLHEVQVTDVDRAGNTATGAVKEYRFGHANAASYNSMVQAMSTTNSQGAGVFTPSTASQSHEHPLAASH